MAITPGFWTVLDNVDFVVQCGRPKHSSQARLDWRIPTVVTFCQLPSCSRWFARLTCGHAVSTFILCALQVLAPEVRRV